MTLAFKNATMGEEKERLKQDLNLNKLSNRLKKEDENKVIT